MWGMRDLTEAASGRSDDRSCRSWNERSHGSGDVRTTSSPGEQLRGAGLGRGAIAHRVKAGAMQRLHIDVYLLGPAPPTPMASARAAALACGADAVVSHRSAACLYGLLPETRRRCPRNRGRAKPVGRRPGIRLHRVARAPATGRHRHERPANHDDRPHDLRPRRHRVRPRHRVRLPGGPVPPHRHHPGDRSRPRPRAAHAGVRPSSGRCSTTRASPARTRNARSSS